MQVDILRANLDDPSHATAIVELIDEYARTPAGQSRPLNPSAKGRLIAGLKADPQQFTLIAIAAEEIIGVAVCHEGFSTFRARPSVNVQDLAVTQAYRSQGIGSKLLGAVINEARRRKACKVTLEVHRSNTAAVRLYQRFGFGPWDEPTLFVARPLQ